MRRILQSQLVLAAFVFLVSPIRRPSTYKAKCQMCHGANGTPSPGMAKMMSIKPVFDPAIKALTADQMFTAVKDSKGKMKPVTGLTDAQIKDAVAFYRGLN